MVLEGRTTHDAAVVGTLYQVKGENWVEARKVISATVGCTVIESEPFVYHVNHGGLL